MGSEKDKIKVLVTGGGGFVGMALIRRLVKLEYSIVSFSRSIYEEHKVLGISIIQGDILNQSEIEKACVGIDVVFHIAAKVGIWGPYNDFYAVNVIGTENVIKACNKNEVKKLIFTSSASVVFDGSSLEGADETIGYSSKPVSNYASTKAKAEQLVLVANSESLKTIALRPHLVWGPGDTQLIPKILRRAKSGRLQKIGKKDFLIDTTYIDNLVDAQLLALNEMDEHSDVNGRAFFITNGEPVPVWTFMNAIIKTFDFPEVNKIVPKNLALIVAWILKKVHLAFRLEKEPFFTRFIILEVCTHHWFDTSKAKELLGYSPRVSFEDGINKLKQSLKK